jgi:hypothetical protein
MTTTKLLSVHIGDMPVSALGLDDMGMQTAFGVDATGTARGWKIEGSAAALAGVASALEDRASGDPDWSAAECRACGRAAVKVRAAISAAKE